MCIRDRCYADDGAIVGGIGHFRCIPVTMIAIEKGHSAKERTARSFGAPHPEGYRKALRLMRQAEKLSLIHISMVLVPQVCDATDLPVIAAGGIADGRGVAAAFMLGACGVQMGTRFLSAEECSIHPAYKEKILKANDLCTMVTGKRLGHPVRSLRTPFARNYAKAEYGGLDDEALEALGTGALRKAVVAVSYTQR